MANLVDISDFTRKLDALSHAYAKLPNEIATTAVNFSKERFREQSWLDKTKENWKPRKHKTGRKSDNRAILVGPGRGHLKKSIHKISADENSIVIGTDVSYAQIHNDGGIIEGTFSVKSFVKKEFTRKRKGRKETVKSHKVGSHTRKIKIRIPSRRFIGNSYTLERRLYLLIASRFAKALKQ